jgi:hypothetical protein
MCGASPLLGIHTALGKDAESAAGGNVTEDDTRALLRDTSRSLEEVARMIEENKAIQRSFKAEAEERRRRHAEIEAQHQVTDQLLDRLNERLGRLSAG